MEAVMGRYLALLRGINVGGKNLIKMAALKGCFEEMGLDGVRTYIQSGNVIFESGRRDQARLTAQIEAGLLATFGLELPVVVRSAGEMERIVAQAPAGFGGEPELYRYDVIFLKEPLTAEEALAVVTAKPGVDEVVGGEGVLYFSRLISKATQSQLSRIVGTPIYQRITIRNWKTTTKLLGMMEAEEG
jgi:uncharacterized protein (DUF1697 family)